LLIAFLSILNKKLYFTILGQAFLFYSETKLQIFGLESDLQKISFGLKNTPIFSEIFQASSKRYKLFIRQ